VLPSSLGIISATFPPQERGMAIGIWSGVVGLGIAIGPLVGGLITEAISWNWIFFVNVPVGLAGLAAAWLLVDESKDPTPDQRLDAGGLILSAVCLGTLTYGLVEGNTYGFGSTRIIVMFVIAVATGAAFLILESRIDKPMLDLSLFRSRNFSGANLTTVIMGFSMLGVFFFVSLFMQNIAHFSPIGAGAAFLPMTMLMMVIPPIAGRQSDRIGARWLIVTGLVLFGLGLIAFATAGIGDGFWALLPGMLLGGAGMSLLFAPTTAVALSSVPMFKAGLASGVLNSARQAGGSLGLAVMGTVVAHDAKSGIAHGKSAASAFVTGYHAAMYIGAGVALVGAVIAGLMITNVKLPARGPGGGPPGGPPGAGPGAGGPPERAADHTADAPQPVGAGAPPAAPGPDAGSGR
jgi:EmrB/QacA subfamily drug resistance transporter